MIIIIPHPALLNYNAAAAVARIETVRLVDCAYSTPYANLDDLKKEFGLRNAVALLDYAPAYTPPFYAPTPEPLKFCRKVLNFTAPCDGPEKRAPDT